MILETSHQIPAPPEKVYAALNDPAVIQRCIDGCESMTPAGENAYEMKVKGGIKGRVQLLEARPPESLKLVVEGKTLGGSVKASVHLFLMAKGDGTQVSGTGDVAIGGFLKALGSKILESQARGMLDEFYRRLSAQVTSSAT